MSVKAYILIATTVGKNKDVASTLREVAHVTSVDLVMGPYDIIVQVENLSLNEIGDLVTTNIHSIPGVSRTLTCLAANPLGLSS